MSSGVLVKNTHQLYFHPKSTIMKKNKSQSRCPMTVLLEKIIILILCGLCLGAYDPTVQIVTLLSVFILSCLCQYFQRRPVTWVICAVYALLSIYKVPFVLFLPLSCYDLMSEKTSPVALLFVPALLLLSLGALSPWEAVYILLLCLTALALQCSTARTAALTEDIKALRDDSTELNRLLEQRNLELIERQNAELSLARLTERNRIAREIHDNVGHLLSRSLLQTGAIRSINREEVLSGHIVGLQDTLNQAMDSIRQSVHGLRDDPMDLYVTIRELTAPYAGNYGISLDYDISSSIPADVKYCFLMLVKEAVTNTAKHSDATEIHISAQEHPVMYQLFIQDNGSNPPTVQKNRGIGLLNMEERVISLDGRFHAGWDRGFRIFASIPVEERKD